MQHATRTMDALLRLPQCVEVEGEKGSKKAVLNLFNGMIIQLPASGGGFSLMGNSSGRVKIGSDCLITTGAVRVHGDKDPIDTTKVLAGEDLTAIQRTWEAQATLLFGAAK